MRREETYFRSSESFKAKDASIVKHMRAAQQNTALLILIVQQCSMLTVEHILGQCQGNRNHANCTIRLSTVH